MMNPMTELEKLKIREDIMYEQTGLSSFKLDEEDQVNSPKHYKTESGFEVIDIIDDFVPDAYSYYMGNVIKYVLRHMNKGKPKQDLEKARWYLNKMIMEQQNA